LIATCRSRQMTRRRPTQPLRRSSTARLRHWLLTHNTNMRRSPSTSPEQEPTERPAAQPCQSVAFMPHADHRATLDGNTADQLSTRCPDDSLSAEGRPARRSASSCPDDVGAPPSVASLCRAGAPIEAAAAAAASATTSKAPPALIWSPLQGAPAVAVKRCNCTPAESNTAQLAQMANDGSQMLTVLP
jgi:hypothetical protein